MSTDSFSTLDHFILSPMLYDSMLSYRSLCEEVQNLSDHDCPLFIALNCNCKVLAIISEVLQHSPLELSKFV